MKPLALHELHQSLDAQFAELNSAEAVDRYGDHLIEHTALRTKAGVLDLSFRSRLCLLGADRVRFLHGQVTNDVNGLRPGHGCYAALTTAKGKMECDLNIQNLPQELLLDFEPGYSQAVQSRLEKFIIADDVQVIDVAPHYGLLSVQGPKAEAVVQALALFPELPASPRCATTVSDPTLGEVYLVNLPRLNTSGFDVFAPTASCGAVLDKLIAAAKEIDGGACGWQAFETVRIEAGIPRYGADMDDTNIPLECGIESRAISYKKGCYIGQEVINRIHSIGHVNKEWRGLRLADDLKALPVKGDKLFKDGKDAGYITSATFSPALRGNIALGYVRREYLEIGTELMLKTQGEDSTARIVETPFVQETGS